ncbi:MAG: hypothetical protein ACRD1B_11035 [Thermoanaerobaculia bacterium]
METRDQTVRARRQFGSLAPLLLSGFVAALGLLPHARLGAQAGSLVFFKSAYDEDTYALWSFLAGGPLLPGRLLSTGMLKAFYELFFHSWDAAEIGADVVLPVLAVWLTWWLASRVTHGVLARVALLLGLLFGQELLSLGNSAIWRSPHWNLGYLRSVLNRSVALVPDYATSYLSLFRTPEPQISILVFLAILILLLPPADASGPPTRVALTAVVLHGSLAFASVWFAAAIVVLELSLAATWVLLGEPEKGIRIARLGGIGLFSVALGSAAFALLGGAGGFVTVLFRSRLPSVSPASVLACALLGGLAFRMWKGIRTDRAALAAACFCSVLALTNQQIVSGWMISVRDWERYVNYPLLILGAALWMSQEGAWRTRNSIVGSRVGLAAVVAYAAFVLVRAELRAYDGFLHDNQESLAMAAALNQISNPADQQRVLVLADPHLAPLLEFRMRRYLPCAIDHTDVFLRRVDPMSKRDGAWGLRSAFKARLFEHFARLGWSPADVSRTLSAEVEQRAGFYLGFLFSIKDYWYPLTDDREVRQEELQAMVPKLVTDYRTLLASQPSSWLQTAIVLTEEGPDRRTAPLFWHERLVGQGRIGSVNVSAWLQTARSGP